ncbi:hypothetical protein PENSTE_c020G10385 [Penicillium steckii]|uniref:Crh-like protein n=1 Tax=Penicillium steckii TaxID=303698 RepID=A0A1V6SVE7_9EURO|nr:hypothetical protein PENSTE_c020G10385 [Penicillium steckii]
MHSFLKYASVALAAMAPLASAQTHSECNPMEKSCPPNKGLTDKSAEFDFTQSSGLDKWTTTAGKVDTGSDGAQFTINKKGDAPTIQSDFYIFYGEVEVTMKAAPGTGIVSSIVLESDDLDEVDWETLGGNNAAVETNYFGKGDTTSYDRDTWPAVDNVQGEFHTYKVEWKKDYIKWFVDGNEVRTLNYKDAQGGSRFPQTPMNIRIGIWAGGDSSNGQGTIEWAGGQTDYSGAPWSMYIKSVSVKNDNPAESYEWTDKSGSSDSIKPSGSSGSQTRDTTTTSSSSSSESTADATTTGADATTTGDATNTATTLSTATQSSSAGKTTPGSGSATASSGAASSSAAGSGSASSTGSSSGSGSDSGSSSTGSGSGSGSSSESGSGSGSATGSSATASPTFNAAANVAANYLGPLSLLAIVTAFIQL